MKEVIAFTESHKIHDLPIPLHEWKNVNYSLEMVKVAKGLFNQYFPFR
jgi:hypothetical protein